MSTEPTKSSILTFTLKIAAGIGTGIVASFVLLVLFMATSSILQPALDPSSTDQNPLFHLVLILIIFLTSLSGNLTAPTLFSFAQRDKYQRRSTSLSHILVFNILTLLFLLPLYMLASGNETGLITSIAALHLLMTTIASMVIFEVISNRNYSLVGIYSTLFAMIIGVGLNFFLYEIVKGNWTVLMFAAMPIIWISIGIFNAIGESLYYWIYTTWGKDFLLATEDYGSDYGQDDEPTDEQIIAQSEKRRIQTESGTDFLKDMKK